MKWTHQLRLTLYLAQIWSTSFFFFTSLDSCTRSWKCKLYFTKKVHSDFNSELYRPAHLYFCLFSNIYSVFITSVTLKHQMKIEKPEQKGGYSLKLFIDGEAAKNFTCAICKNVLRNAVQIPQSNDPKRACKDCYEDSIRYVSTFLMLYAC